MLQLQKEVEKMNMSLKITLNLATLLLSAVTAHFANSASIAVPNADDDGLASISAPAYVKEHSSTAYSSH